MKFFSSFVFYSKKSIIYSWILSYLLILLIPVIISGIIYIRSSTIVENEVNRANNALLKQLQQVMDSQMLDVERLSVEVALSPRVTGLVNSFTPLQDYQRYSITEIVNALKTYKIANSFVEDFYIYFKNYNIVLTPTASYDPVTLYNTLHKNDDLSYDQWMNLMNENHSKDYISINKKINTGEASNSIAFIQSLPLGNNNRETTTVFIRLNNDRFQEAVKEIKWMNEAETCILDRNNEILATNQLSTSQELLDYKNLTGNSGMVRKNTKSGGIVISFISSQVSDWKYVTIVPANVFWEKVGYVRKLTIIGLLICLVIGCFIAFTFSKRNYSPLKTLVRYMGSKSGIIFNKENNEYRYIQDAISNTIDEKETISIKLEQQKAALCSDFLMRLIKGRLEKNIPIYEALSSFGIKFDTNSFVVLMLYVEEFEKSETEMDNADSNEELELVLFSISNIFKESIEKKYNIYITEINDMPAYLINPREDSDINDIDPLINIVTEAQKIIENRFHIYFTIASSSIQHNIQGITKAYTEAMEAMEYKLVMGRGKIIKYESIKTTKNNIVYSMETEHQFVNFIKAGDREKANLILEEIFNDNFIDACLSIQMSKCLMFDLVSTMIKTLNEIGISFENSFVEELNPVDRLLKCNTLEEMKHQMTEILIVICDYIEKKKKSHNFKLKDKIIKYINENYHNPNLNISIIAETFDLNPAYLSRYFKEQAGEGILDYINKVRLEKAKYFFKTNGWNVGDVAEKVGYCSTNNFIRAFKKYEGVTPGMYKES